VTLNGVGRKRILFDFVLYGEMRVGIRSKGDAPNQNVMVSSRGIRCSRCTPRGRRPREIRVSITLVGVVGVGRVPSRVWGAAEGVHVAIASPMAMASLTVHVIIRESIVTEKARWRRVGDMRRNRMSTLGRG
jgi:hypothetical protein